MPDRFRTLTGAVYEFDIVNGELKDTANNGPVPTHIRKTIAFMVECGFSHVEITSADKRVFECVSWLN